MHFGNQLYWECACLRACETFPVGFDHPAYPVGVDDRLSRIKWTIQQSKRQDDPGLHEGFTDSPRARDPEDAFDDHGLFSTWGSVISTFSLTQFTRLSDRLVALRGIVNGLARHYCLESENYGAGIWKACAPETLLWAREDSRDWAIDNPLLRHFPSWSWASCNSETRFCETTSSRMLREYFIKVLVIESSDDQTHTAKTAHILLHGKPLCLRDPFSLQRQEQQFNTYGLVEDNHGNSSKDIFVELDRPIPPLLKSMSILPAYQDMNIMRGLILGYGEVDEGIPTYVRFGCFTCDFQALSHESFFSFRSAGEMDKKVNASPILRII